MRFYRSDEPELWEEPEPVFRDDRIRELVDKLPKDVRRMIEAVYFAGMSPTQAARSLGVSFDKGQRLTRRGLEALRAGLQSES